MNIVIMIKGRKQDSNGNSIYKIKLAGIYNNTILDITPDFTSLSLRKGKLLKCGSINVKDYRSEIVNRVEAIAAKKYNVDSVELF